MTAKDGVALMLKWAEEEESWYAKAMADGFTARAQDAKDCAFACREVASLLEQLPPDAQAPETVGEEAEDALRAALATRAEVVG